MKRGIVGLKDRLRKLRQEAEEGAVVVHLKDGSRRYFDDMDVFGQMFLAKVGLFRGNVPDSPVVDAVRNATPESRRAFEDEYGPVVGMKVAVVATDWVEVHTLSEIGEVETTRHEGEEAERIKAEARRNAAGGSFL